MDKTKTTLRVEDSPRRGGLAVSAYKAFQKIRRLYWTISGGRKEAVFGEKFYFAPSTHFPAYRGLRLPEREIFSTVVRYGDYVQTHSAYLFLAELQHPPVVVDVGAHHGVYAILLGRLAQQKKGKVIAVEPNPAAFKILQENIRLNNLEDTVKCENVAIMERAGTVHFAADDEQSRIAQLNDSYGFNAEAIPLSSLLKKYSAADVDLMIIDVEGAELNVLRSFDWEKCWIGRIFCELHPYNWKHFGCSGNDVSEFLTQHGYRCLDMYLREHKKFTDEAYIGPTIFVSK